MEVERVSVLGLDSLGQQIQKGFGGGSGVSSDKDSDWGLVDGQSFLDQKALEGGSGGREVDLIDKLFDFGFYVFFEHVAPEIGDFDSVVFLFVVASRYNDPEVLVGLGLVVDGHQGAHSEGDLATEGRT